MRVAERMKFGSGIPVSRVAPGADTKMPTLCAADRREVGRSNRCGDSSRFTRRPTGRRSSTRQSAFREAEQTLRGNAGEKEKG